MATRLRAAILVAIFCACSGEAAISDVDGESDGLWSTSSNVIVGTVNWKSTTLLPAGSGFARNAKAVGFLTIPAEGARCTAWLVGDDKIVTNNHCIPDAAAAVGARVSFNYEDGVAPAARIWFDCSTFVQTWLDVDATVLSCKARGGTLPGQLYGTVTLGTASAATASSVYVIHQNCDYYANPSCVPTKKYSPGLVQNGDYTPTEISYSADTLGGSSGSAVFSATHQLVALHHLGLGGDASGRGAGNAGVKITSLRTRLAEVGIR